MSVPNLKRLLVLLVVLFLCPAGYDTCRPVWAAEQSVLLVVPGCNA